MDRQDFRQQWSIKYDLSDWFWCGHGAHFLSYLAGLR